MSSQIPANADPESGSSSAADDALRRALIHEFAELRGDLVQVRSVFDDAVGVLGAAFDGLNRRTKAQRRAVDSLLGLVDARSAGQATAVSTLAAQISGEVAAAVTGLQFGDIVTQLLARTERRLAALATLSVAAVDAGTSQTRSLEAIEAHRIEREEIARGSIDQVSMDIGEVDLF